MLTPDKIESESKLDIFNSPLAIVSIFEAVKTLPSRYQHIQTEFDENYHNQMKENEKESLEDSDECALVSSKYETLNILKPIHPHNLKSINIPKPSTQ